MLQAPAIPADTFAWSDLLTPADGLEAWTAILALATIALVAVAAIGLRSLSLTRKDIGNRNTREIAQHTIDRCREMCDELIPLLGQFLEGLSEKGVALFVEDAGQVSFKADEEAKKINAAIHWMEKLEPELLAQTITLANKLECWSTSFTHDPALADQEFAFEPCSSVYCQMIMMLYPAFLTQRRTNPASGPYQNAVTLFESWYSTKQQAQLLEQLERAKEDEGKLPPLIGNES